ncbi:MAG: tol-pal system protein YbgF [endosymbiont of Galathealinum brachiosum]|uniref:Cell division coordinator CpoB n=1 Tax=endosymbiont of Galathealinum brachiosum TaxID=2200906 RepID=A0A370DJ93_9GAMM|nr:MAG: tol-pal system protein YbgF [endosymbiont of Galathealinum brachiosum]
MSSNTVRHLVKPLFISILLTTSAPGVFAENGLSVEQRLGRLENLLQNQVLVEQTRQMEQIQHELTALRELLEAQEHQLGLIKQRQRNLYQDMDRRLNDLEIKGGGVSASSGASSGVAPAVSGASSVPPPGSATVVSNTPAVIAAPVVGDKNGKSAYTQAFNTLKEGKYQQAIMAFNSFQQTYPESVYGANAQYWLGEAYSVSRDYKTALSEFQKVVSQYPQSNKAEGAMLKIGYTYYEMQDWASAKTALGAVINKYPGTTVTRKAKERLQRMKREGH